MIARAKQPGGAPGGRAKAPARPIGEGKRKKAKRCTHVAGWCVRGTNKEEIAMCGAILGSAKLRGGRRIPAGGYTFTVVGVRIRVRPVSRCSAVRTISTGIALPGML